MMIVTLLCAFILSFVAIQPALSFNTVNKTGHTIYVTGNIGNYSERVGPHKTSKGWKLDKTIKLTVCIYKQYCVNNTCEWSCKSKPPRLACKVSPHQQQIVYPAGKDGIRIVCK